MSPAWIEPDWPAPRGIRAASSLRLGGRSTGVFASLNLGAHVGDEPAAVAANRAVLVKALDLPAEPVWLQQVHGTEVVTAHDPGAAVGDAATTDRAGVVCAVMTADCLPVLLCAVDGSQVAAAHAGWRGLAGGVLEAAAAAMQGDELMAWLGPAIGPEAFEVGDEVRETFVRRLGDCGQAFVASGEGRWRADLYHLARLALQRAGVDRIYGGGWCTYSEAERFFSYRRDGQTGRMATLIWREA